MEKKNKTKESGGVDISQLKEKAKNLRISLREMRFNLSLSQLYDTTKISKN